MAATGYPAPLPTSCPPTAQQLPIDCHSLARQRALTVVSSGATPKVNNSTAKVDNGTTTVHNLRLRPARPLRASALEPGATCEAGPGQLARRCPGSGRGHLRPPFASPRRRPRWNPTARSAVVAQLEQEWPLLARRELAVALARWRGTQPALRRFQRTEDLLVFLHGAAPARERRAAACAARSRRATTGRPAGSSCRRSCPPSRRRHGGSHVARRAREELWELLLFHAWEAICTYPVTRRRRVAANLVLQVLHDTSRELRAQLARVEAEHGRASVITARARVRSARPSRARAAAAPGWCVPR